MCPTEYTAAKIAKAKANEIVLNSALPNGLLPVSKTVSGTEPAPMKTRIVVPMTSAVSFCDRVGDDDMLGPLMFERASRLRSGGFQRGDVRRELYRERCKGRLRIRPLRHDSDDA